MFPTENFNGEFNFFPDWISSRKFSCLSPWIGYWFPVSETGSAVWARPSPASPPPPPLLPWSPCGTLSRTWWRWSRAARTRWRGNWSIYSRGSKFWQLTTTWWPWGHRRPPWTWWCPLPRCIPCARWRWTLPESELYNLDSLFSKFIIRVCWMSLGGEGKT